MRLFSIVFCLIILPMTPALAGHNASGHTAGIHPKEMVLHGTIRVQDLRHHRASIKVYRGKDPVQELTTKRSGKFELRLHLHATYRVEVSRKGYATRYYTIDTHLPDVAIDQHHYFLHTKLLPLPTEPSTGPESAAPITIEYRESTHRFGRTH